ncbi:hypothetical protein EUTSA_v10028995mg [Eutrema salsugineum]|uniref:Myb-like domain-containing protein n=1 Tax=Eutrema salsugineum TaxID=72664 RepID=V4L4G5_EUTSA|nr:hypothetical protein EUTSA_v10028995mg [Eutrema salsugineum]
MAFSSTGPAFTTSNFVELLNSQQDSVFCGYLSSFLEESPASIGEASPATEKKERRQWSPSDDILLISSWLNTSKDAVIEAIQCKQRWQKINDQVCKFCGAYEAACRETQPCDEDNGGKRPAGVKASKAKGKKPAVEKEEPLLALQVEWQIQEKDLEMKAKTRRWVYLNVFWPSKGHYQSMRKMLRRNS